MYQVGPDPVTYHPHRFLAKVIDQEAKAKASQDSNPIHYNLCMRLVNVINHAYLFMCLEIR